MSGSVNKVILIGNLGRDPEGKDVGGQRMVRMSIATSERWTSKDTGEKKESTTWHNVVIWNEKLAEIAERFLRKGSKVYIEGQLQTRKWTDKDGQDRYTTEVVLQRFRGELVMLGDKGGAAAGTSDDWQAPVTTGAAGGSLAFDDEIPF